MRVGEQVDAIMAEIFSGLTMSVHIVRLLLHPAHVFHVKCALAFFQDALWHSMIDCCFFATELIWCDFWFYVKSALCIYVHYK